MVSAYRSFSAQTRHYFERPHENLPDAPLTGATVWRGAALAKHPERWQVNLSPAEVEEIEAAARTIVEAGRPLADVDRSGFPLPTLTAKVDQWRDAIALGPGFVVVRGLPVTGWATELAEAAFWGIGHHLGIPGAQNPDQELLGHVRDYHEAQARPDVRLYRTAANIDFHCDAADVVGLLCLRQAPTGGESRIVSTHYLFNEVLRQQPDLVAELFEPFLLDGRGEQRAGMPLYSRVTPCAYARGELRTFYHSEYMRSVERHPEITLSTAHRRLLDLYDATAADPDVHLEMRLEPGDMQLLSNHSIAHARGVYEDDPSAPRHLLRLWLSLY